MPAIAPRDRPVLPDGEGLGEVLDVADAAEFGEDDIVDVVAPEDVAEDVLLLSTSPEIVEIEPK